MVIELPIMLPNEGSVLRKALEALIEVPAAAAADPSLRASGSEARVARTLMARLDRLVDQKVRAARLP